jgi:hypothetical protein
MYNVSGLFFVKDTEGQLTLFSSPAMDGSMKNGLVNEITILKSRPIAEATLRQLDFGVEYYTKSTFINNELYQNTPILIEVNWKEPQIIQGLISVRWANDKEFSLSFEDQGYVKYLPDGSKTKLEIIPEPTLFPFGEWIQTNNISIRVTKTGADSDGEILVKFRDLESLIGEYSGKIIIENSQKEGSILEMGLLTPNVRKGEVYINKLMETYLFLELEEKNEVASNTVRFIDSQVAGVSDS